MANYYFSFYRLLVNLDNLASSIVVGEEGRYISVSSEIALSVAVQSRESMLEKVTLPLSVLIFFNLLTSKLKRFPT